MISIICPSCFEAFDVVAPSPAELPAELDYDCEICCRPMIIRVADGEGGALLAEARSLDE